MSYERLWPKAQQAFTADGQLDGGIQVADTTGFFVGAYVSIFSNALQPRRLQIKKITTEVTPYIIYVGSGDEKISDIRSRTDVSAYLISDDAQILQPQQEIGFIKPEYIANATYERDPVKAWRVEPVDTKGNPISATNPLPVAIDGSISIGDVSIVEGGNTMTVNPDGSINVNEKSVGLFTLPYDSISATYPSSTVELYQSYLGGLTGTAVQLVTVIYTDATKNVIQSVVRTPQGP